MNFEESGPVPDRWLNCPRISNQLIADKFLAFKTPLSERFKDKLATQHLFPPDMIFGYVKSLKLKLGLWIDLTYTKRFYNRENVEKHGCKYIKLQCRGHGETPSVEQTKSFIEIVDDFINERPLDIIGVHCTHGFNRTGFLIISYMVEKLDCSVEAALNSFARTRPPGIYKEDYIRELYRRYDDEEDIPPVPDRPDWVQESDNDLGKGQNDRKRQHSSRPTTSATNYSQNGNSSNDECGDNDSDNEGWSTGNKQGDDGCPPVKRKRKELVKKDATFMAGVPGVTLILDQALLSDLKEKVHRMCEWESNGFPGCQPVSMDMSNIENLRNKPYRVSWKADGTRYMMLIKGENEIYFFDRDFSCFEVENLSFRRRENLHHHLVDTLIDGEMVIDKFNGKSIPRYLIYDIIKYEGEDVGKSSFFPDRLRCIRKEIIEPRHEAIRRGLIDRAREPFSVRDKEFWEVTQAAALLGPKFAKQLCHEPDGLIFQPSVDPYKTGQCEEVLKWKPLSLNSIDFKLRITQESGVGILSRKIGLLYVGGQDVPFAKIKYTKSIKDLDNKIIECKFENNEWVFMRERVDKSYPNSYKTAISVLNSIKHPVTTELLLYFIEKYRFKDDNEMMPPPSAQKRSH